MLRLPQDGRWQITILRIGFAPTLTSVLVSGEDVVRVTVVARSAPVMLQAVRVRGATECRVRPDTGLLVARAWEEARKAMLTVTLQSQDSTLFGEWVDYSRTTDSTGRLIIEQRVSVQRHVTQHVFRNESGDELARTGYVTTDSAGITFNAPDPEVLLSDAFASSHCLGLVAASLDNQSLIGVSFKPTQSPRNFYDIEGTIWIDATTSQLRSVNFTYTNLPNTHPTIAGGGEVKFARLSSGIWIVSSWYAQLPMFTARPSTSAPGTSSATTGVVTPVVQTVHSTGGDAFRISSGDSTLIVWPMPNARIQLVSHDSRVPIAGAHVTLRGTNVDAVSDSLGFASIGPLPAGRYEMSIELTAVDSIEAPTIKRELAMQTGAPIDTVVLPDMPALLRRVCSELASTAGTAVLRGTVADVRGQFVPHATIEVTFLRVDARLLKIGSVKWNEETVRAETNDRGRWSMCGIPHETDLTITVRGNALTAKRQLKIDDTKTFVTVNLVVQRLTSPHTPALHRPPLQTHQCWRPSRNSRIHFLPCRISHIARECFS